MGATARVRTRGIDKDKVQERPRDVPPNVRDYINVLLDKASDSQLGVILQFMKRIIKA